VGFKFCLITCATSALLLLLSHFGFTQSTGLKGWLEKRSAKKEARIAAGEPFLSPLVGPGYTPETGLLIAGGFLYTFKTNSQDSLIQRSSLPITAFLSTKGNVGFSAKLASFWWQDRIRFNLVAKYSDADDDYFGVGFATADNIPQSDTTSRYHLKTLIFNPHFLVRLLPGLYGGILLNINQTEVTEVNPVMAEDPAYLQYGPDNFNSGLGVSLGYDNRDLTVNAWKGWYARFTATFFGEYLQSDNNYEVYEMDVRTYHQIQRPANVIAVKLYGRFSYGEVPYEDMTLLGGGGALRGYIRGKYRDKSGIYFITEWRHMFLNPEGEPGKHGIAAWLGSGSVGPTIEGMNEWVPNLGIGYRWEVQPRMNLRIDLGIGRESSGLYFNFTEAF